MGAFYRTSPGGPFSGGIDIFLDQCALEVQFQSIACLQSALVAAVSKRCSAITLRELNEIALVSGITGSLFAADHTHAR
jgi:hypothetical protein